MKCNDIFNGSDDHNRGIDGPEEFDDDYDDLADDENGCESSSSGSASDATTSPPLPGDVDSIRLIVQRDNDGKPILSVIYTGRFELYELRAIRAQINEDLDRYLQRRLS